MGGGGREEEELGSELTPWGGGSRGLSLPKRKSALRAWKERKNLLGCLTSGEEGGQGGRCPFDSLLNCRISKAWQGSQGKRMSGDKERGGRLGRRGVWALEAESL